MQQRQIPRLRRTVSVVGLGTWQLGADWGDVPEAKARAVLDAALEGGVTFFDTADVYGDGRSERLCGELHQDHPGLRAMARPNVATGQMIFNGCRQKSLGQVLPSAREAGVGISARVPLASGLLSGRYDENTVFAPDDHRNFNRHGEAFDVGETF